MDAQRRLPWWKEIVLNNEYRERIRCLVTARYREEMRILQYHPEQIAPACWDDGSEKCDSAQFIRVREDVPWSRKHPMSVIKVSSFQVLRKTAEAVVVPETSEVEEACVLEEIKRQFLSEKEESRIYGLSYAWDCQLPPHGFIRLTPSPLAAMWPSLAGLTRTMCGDQRAGPPPSIKDATQRDPLCVNVFRENGEYLGAWRQSLLLLRFKITCWALHEEERQRTSTNVLPTIPVMNSAVNVSPILEDVPVFSLPILRLQSGTVTYKRKSFCVDLDSIVCPTTWEGIAPSPTLRRDELSYQNWHFIHRGSALAYQSLRDIYDLLPHDKDGFLTKETYVEFTLDLLNLFFPTFLSSTSIDIAEEEWIFRGTTDLVNFETFFENFFSFPFTLLRDLSSVSRDQYAEVWCLVRICLLETSETIDSSAGNRETNEKKKFGEGQQKNFSQQHLLRKQNSKAVILPLGDEEIETSDKDKADTKNDTYVANAVRRPIIFMGGTLTSVQKLRVVKERAKKKHTIPLICDIVGLSHADIISLGDKDFRNNDNYALYSAKKCVARDKAEMLRWVPPSHLANVLHILGGRNIAKKPVTSSKSSFHRHTMKKEVSDLHAGTTFSSSSGQDYRTSGLDFNASIKGPMSSRGMGANSSIVSDSTAPSLALNSATSHRVSSSRLGRVRERLAALTRLEDERRIRSLCDTSVLYQNRRRRQNKDRRAVLMQVLCSHSGWEMYHDDVFEAPEETHDAEDALVGYVLDFPDDFFDDAQHSLRERYFIQQELLSARMKQRRDQRRQNSATSTNDPMAQEKEKQTPAPHFESTLGVCSTYMSSPRASPSLINSTRCHAGHTPTADSHEARWSDRPIAGWSRRDAGPLLQSMRVFMRVPWGVKDLPPRLTASECVPPRRRLADSDPSIWLPPRRDSAGEAESEGDTETEAMEEVEIPQREGIHPRRALRLRMRMKERIDAQYMKKMQKWSRHNQMLRTPRRKKRKTHSPGSGTTLPSLSRWRS